MALSDKFAEARATAGLTQSELARRLGIRPQSVQAWESGVSAPRARRLSQVAEVLGVPEAFFFEEVKGLNGEEERAEPASKVLAAKDLADRVISLAEADKLDKHAITVLGELLELLARKTR